MKKQVADAKDSPVADLQRSVDALTSLIADRQRVSEDTGPLSWSDDRLCTRDEACRLAKALGIPASKSKFERLAVTGGGPPISYYGERKPLYQVGELKAWLASRIRKARSTADLKRAANALRGGRDE